MMLEARLSYFEAAAMGLVGHYLLEAEFVAAAIWAVLFTVAYFVIDRLESRYDSFWDDDPHERDGY